MPTCVPIRALKDTGEFSRTVQNSPTPVIVTKNGKESMVVMTAEAYDCMQFEISKGKLMRRIDQAEREIAEGRYMDGDEAMAKIRERYGI